MSDIACLGNSENTLLGTNISHQTSLLKMLFLIFLWESVGCVSSLECIPQQEPEFKFCMTYITFIVTFAAKDTSRTRGTVTNPKQVDLS